MNTVLHAAFTLIFALTALAGAVAAQSLPEKRSPDRGFRAGQAYSVSDIETVNTTNGNLILRLPVASLPAGRGGSGFTLSLFYNSKLYDSFAGPGNDPGGRVITSNHLRESAAGGWRYGHRYELRVVNRGTVEEIADCVEPLYDSLGEPVRSGPSNQPNYNCVYLWKVVMVNPDGSESEFRPTGYSDYLIPGAGIGPQGGYFNISPAGHVLSVSFTYEPPMWTDPLGYWRFAVSSSQDPRTEIPYYSTDGSRSRLLIARDGGWELSLADGGRIVQPATGPQRIYDRNSNYVEISQVADFRGTGHSAEVITDQLGRQIAVEHAGPDLDLVHEPGTAGEDISTTVAWKEIAVEKPYTAREIAGGRYRGTYSEETYAGTFRVIDGITLPVQAGALAYGFGYNADAGSPVSGWGELNRITTPAGAVAAYEYVRDDFQSPNPMHHTEDRILRNAVRKKTLSWSAGNGGAAGAGTEVWEYSVEASWSSVTAPDGSVTYREFGDVRLASPDAGRVFLEETRDTGLEGARTMGRTEYEYAQNALPYAFHNGNPSVASDLYVRRRYFTVFDAAGNPALTSAAEYAFDQNGNETQRLEYGWTPYAQMPRTGNRITGIPAAAPLQRVTLSSYYFPAPDASSGTDTPAAYWNAAAPRLRGALASREVRSGQGAVFSRSEFFYDDAANTGNLTLTRTWDSPKGPCGSPLTAANSVAAGAQYDQYGNPVLLTDAREVQTRITYGNIPGPSGSVAGLYPTETVTAYGTPEAQAVSAGYDFHTGLQTSVTSHGNTAAENVTTATEYDALGRPVKVRAADGTPLEAWTVTEYDDVNRRVIVRSDLAEKGDGRRVSVRHLDQLGRVRLARTLEDGSSESPYDETQGIKVETRYLTGNGFSYRLTSNPFRAATSGAASNEPSMGWTLTRVPGGGRWSETETFAGAAMPAPFGSNQSSTGTIRTETDADLTMATDQSGRRRVSRTDALGRLTDVWEVTAEGTGTEPIALTGYAGLHGYRTSYSYNALDNLLTVSQGEQTRTFSYSSLSRLTSAANPESGTIGYLYDPNGNLLQKTDARGVVTTSAYDALNRVTQRSYTTPNGTPGTGPLANYQPASAVTYAYDDPQVPFSKGRLTKVTNGTSETRYLSFDLLGRVTSQQQATDGETYSSGYSYDLAGQLTEQTYPSGRKVRTDYQADGSLEAVLSRKTPTSGYWRTYASEVTYSATGAVTSMRLGNGRWESTQFNSRLQPTRIALGSVQGATDLLKLEYEYGDWTGNGTIDSAKNNGNILRQTITVPEETRSDQTYPAFTAVQSYSYDQLNRITSAEEKIGTVQQWRQGYKFDRYGNRNFIHDQTTTLPKECPNASVCEADKAKYDPDAEPLTNRLKEDQFGDTAKEYEFDASGNMINDSEGRQFFLDGENKQTEVKDLRIPVTVQNPDLNVIGRYFYDGDGKRVKKEVWSGGAAVETVVFVCDAAGRLIAEYSTAPAPQEPKVNYVTNDHLGSPRINTDQDGRVTARHDYIPYGEEITRQSYGADAVRQKFTGYERDQETDLEFAQARYYSKQHGRFITVDPLMASAVITVTQSWNRYSYALNNPLKYVDPTGEAFKDLTEEQLRVFQSYVDLQNKGREKPLTTEEVYNGLTEDQQTTFESVTHALENTQLTDDKGKPITDKDGKQLNALNLVEGVTQITGQQDGKPGTEQFRLLVDLKEGAIDTFENSKQFEKGGGFLGIGGGHIYKDGKVTTADNLRQTGKGAKLQVSYLKTNMSEADIDVDYRSKYNVPAHNRPDNSDVRSGENLRRHNERYGKENPLRNVPQIK